MLSPFLTWCGRRALTSSLVLLALAAQAQTAPVVPQIQLSAEDLARGRYGPQRNFYFLPPGKTAEQDYVNAGFFGQRLRPYVQANPEALRELNNYRRQKNLFLADKAVLLGAALVYSTQVFGQSEAQYFNSTQRVAVGAAVVSLVGTLFINRRTNEYFQQAVEVYNAGPAPRRGWLRPPTPGLTVAQGRPLLQLRWAVR